MNQQKEIHLKFNEYENAKPSRVQNLVKKLKEQMTVF